MGEVLPGDVPESEFDHLTIDFDTIYRLSNRNPAVAVASYWVTPLVGSGHCYKPHYALLLKTKRSYSLIREDFMQDWWELSRIHSSNSEDDIFALDYDCPNDKPLRKVIVKLKY